MKKVLCVVTVLIMLVGCTPVKKQNNPAASTKSYITGVWISYAELDSMLKSRDFKNCFENALVDCKQRGITDAFVHTRAFCDSLYPSKYFPLRESAAGYDFDILEFMISSCHENGIRFHAWLNPYRVRTADGDIQNLSAESPARKWIEDTDASNDINVCFNDGIYLNPASDEVRRLVIDGIREIAGNYAVDGIHFDDYFYPTQSEDFDASSYGEYCNKNKNPLSLDEWRRANVNALISGSYTAIKFISSDIVFSISPSASVEQNYSRYYADIKLWIESRCVDYIIPQLYFGFEYPDADFRFDGLLESWQRITKNTDTRLLIGLASYKINTENEPDRAEWANGVRVIDRQIQLCKENPQVLGHVYFSYTSMCEYIN